MIMTSNVWTQAAITEWAVRTFGQPDSAQKLINRANEEFRELRDSVYLYKEESTLASKTLEEVADVVIILSQVCQYLGGDLQDEISKKMIKNLGREWISTGAGVGRHA